jgi:hypothetical protein
VIDVNAAFGKSAIEEGELFFVQCSIFYVAMQHKQNYVESTRRGIMSGGIASLKTKSRRAVLKQNPASALFPS